MGVQSVRAKARRKLKCMSLRLAFYIRIELDRSNVDGRSFQALTDKMLYFQGLYGFCREHLVFLNFLKSIESTGKTGFFSFTEDSSQTVVIIMWRLHNLPLIRKNRTARKRLSLRMLATNTRQQSNDCCRVFLRDSAFQRYCEAKIIAGRPLMSRSAVTW